METPRNPVTSNLATVPSSKLCLTDLVTFVWPTHSWPPEKQSAEFSTRYFTFDGEEVGERGLGRRSGESGHWQSHEDRLNGRYDTYQASRYVNLRLKRSGLAEARDGGNSRAKDGPHCRSAKTSRRPPLDLSFTLVWLVRVIKYVGSH